jgi:5-oxoprolinase (ATP-hydrolysing) subunit A
VRIDLNCDVGEGFGSWPGGPDAQLMPIITSANVACGGHAGDPTIMRRTCQAALQANVAIGAQVGYPDLAGFGRRFVDMAPADLANEVIAQVGALSAIAAACGGAVRYVKPHGALYNTVVSHDAQATAVVAAVADMATAAGPLPLLGLPGSALQRIAERRSVPFVAEGFADRGYRADGTLTPRGEPGALLTERGTVEAQVLRLASGGVASLCVHSDSPGAVELATWTRQALVDTGYELRSFAL